MILYLFCSLQCVTPFCYTIENKVKLLLKKVTRSSKIKISQNFILFITSFSVMLPFFHTQKVTAHCKE